MNFDTSCPAKISPTEFKNYGKMIIGDAPDIIDAGDPGHYAWPLVGERGITAVREMDGQRNQHI